eukprot:s60_g18.t1
MRSVKHRSCARMQSIPSEVLWSKRGCPAESLRLLPTRARIWTFSISGVGKNWTDFYEHHNIFQAGKMTQSILKAKCQVLLEEAHVPHFKCTRKNFVQPWHTAAYFTRLCL